MRRLSFILFLLVSVLCFLVSLSNAQEEKITITTYYPSPYGSYNELRSTRMAIGKDYIQGSYVCWQGDTGCTGSYPQVQIPTDPSDPDVDLIVQGNVGIGTTGPGGILHVTKNAPWPQFSSVIFANTGAGSSGVEIRTAVTDTSRGYPYIDFTFGSTDDAGGGTPDGTARIFNVKDGINKLFFGFNYPDTTRPDQVKVTIQQDGNVGIGTTGPGDKLEIKEGHLRIDGAAPAAYGVRFFRDGIIYGKLATGNNDINLDLVNGADFIVSNGNLGIGTTSPQAKLDVNGTAKIANWASQNLAANGYAKIGSLLVQWGKTANIDIGGSAAVTFPIQFNAVFNVTTTREEATTANSFGISVGNITNTGFTAYSNGARGGPQYWFAIGY